MARRCGTAITAFTVITLVLGPLAVVFAGEITCRPNAFEGESCTGPGWRSTSQPNVFHGYDTTYSDGSRTRSRPNIVGGSDVTGPRGTVRSQPNAFGGEDYALPTGKTVRSRPNIFGGQDFEQPDGKVVTCQPNVFGGTNCRRR